VAKIRNLVVKIGADISSLSKGLKTAQSKLMKLSSSLTSIGTSLTMKVTMPLVLLAKQALQTSAEFEQSMANAASVSGATGEELEKMTALAREMGKTTVFSASDAADAMYYMASAGYKVEFFCNPAKWNTMS
jgi:prophage DNA circulation protein